jgi:hypothetical protein
MDQGVVRYEDENTHKGHSTITLPITVTEPGRYEVSVLYGASRENARAVLVEVWSHDAGRPGRGLPAVVPPPREAHFRIDQSEDTVAFRELDGEFRFGPADYLEINNTGTRKLVTADAVKFIPSQGPTILVDNHEAEGRERWKVFKPTGQFRAYNQVGPDSYSDSGTRKGELWLRYKPSQKKDQWNPEAMYRVQVGYPAKRDHETATPVIVKA